MAEIQLGVIEARYADMIWEHEPVSSSELVKLTEEAFTGSAPRRIMYCADCVTRVCFAMTTGR